jgi:hypothetical protein
MARKRSVARRSRRSLSDEDALSIALGESPWVRGLYTTTVGPISKSQDRAYVRDVIASDSGTAITATSPDPSRINLSAEERAAWDGFTLEIRGWRLDDDEAADPDDPPTWPATINTRHYRVVAVRAWEGDSPLGAQQLWLSSGPREHIYVRKAQAPKWKKKELQRAARALELIRERGGQMVGKLAKRPGPTPKSPEQELAELAQAAESISARHEKISLDTLSRELPGISTRDGVTKKLGRSPVKNLRGLWRHLGISYYSSKKTG